MVLAEKICIVLQVDLQGLIHASDEPTEHERIRKISHADGVFVKKYCCLRSLVATTIENKEDPYHEILVGDCIECLQDLSLSDLCPFAPGEKYKP